MNAVVQNLAPAAVPLAHSLLALLAPADVGRHDAPAAQWLATLPAAPLARTLTQWLRQPPAEDAPLQRLTLALPLHPGELCAVALALAADTDPRAARAIAWLQAPLDGGHPSLGLVAGLQAQRGLGAGAALAELLDGAALDSGLLTLTAQARTLADTCVRLPQPLVAALAGGVGRWSGVTLGAIAPSDAGATNGLASDVAPLAGAGAPAQPPLAESQLFEAHRHGQALAALAESGRDAALAVRSGHPLEARAACAAIAAAQGRRAAFIEGEAPAGLGPWLLHHDALPVLCAEAAPGERRELPRLPGWRGPRLVATGPDGAWECAGQAVPAWSVPLPPAAERAALWARQLGDTAAAQALGRQHRHASARIAQLAQALPAGALQGGDAAALDPMAAQEADPNVPAEPETPAESASPPPDADAPAGLPARSAALVRAVARAARGEGAQLLGALAQPLVDDIPPDALILPPALHAELQALLLRCRVRDGLADGLGPAARARYRPGVRALLVGPSGTGKTLAAGWMATQLGLPLYRVDIASISSKYIGETEKNLAELFARAEHAEVVLLFDEADALFGKRTDTKDAHDRYANQQTNYLLQRMEAFDGIALLTSNSRARFDTAFTRRFDAIVEFTAPTPAERRALWLAHLGQAHALDMAALNRLAAACDLAGGHVRNVVLAARALAQGRAIAWPELAPALALEYRKLGKPLPTGLGA